MSTSFSDLSRTFTNGITSSSSTAFWGPNTVPLNSDEQREIENLEKERQQLTITLRKAAFGKLPAHIRNFVLSSIECALSSNSISNIEAEKSERQRQLEARYYGVQYMSGFNTGGFKSGMNYFSAPDIPPYRNTENMFNFGLTYEELKEAHIDACMEEIVLNKESTP